MAGDLPDLHVLREGSAPGQVVLVDQLDQGLGCLVDHRVGHHASLAQRRPQRQAGEDVSKVYRAISDIRHQRTNSSILFLNTDDIIRKIGAQCVNNQRYRV